MFEIKNECFCFPLKNISVLQRLVDNGLAELKDEKIYVPFFNIYELDLTESELVELPPLYPFEILIKPLGNMASDEFSYQVLYKTFAPAGENLPLVQKNGPCITVSLKNENIEYLLSNEQYSLIWAIDNFNEASSSQKQKHYNNRQFAAIKKLAQIKSAKLDGTLESKNVVLPKNVKILFDENAGNICLKPSVDGVDEAKFNKLFDKKEEVLESYAILDGGKKTVVEFDEHQKDVLSKIKSLKGKPSSEIRKVIEHPEEYFDPEYADLSDFYSDRVIGIGLYQPKVYPFISPYKSQWIPSFIVEDRTNGTKNLAIHSVDELGFLEAAIDQAKNSNEVFFEFDGINLDISTAESIAKHAKEVLAKNEPVDSVGPNSIEEKKKETPVLLIEDNMESVGFDQSTGKMSLPKEAVLKTDEFLKPSIALKEHQKEGIAWLQYCLDNAKGALLGDDMGLGKTLQVLYLVDWHYRNLKGNKPYLIVAPVSLLENWENEYAKFFDNGMKVSVISRIPSEDDQFVKDHSYPHIMLMSYECMRRGQLVIGKIDFSIIVMDEAQKIKEPATMVTNAAKALKGDFKIAMTGTPVENTFMNLWCIMDFAVPGYLGTAKNFAQKYQKPLRDPKTDVKELGEQLHNDLGGYFLRRLKSDVAKELPQKIIQSKENKMPAEQQQRYKMSVEMGIGFEPGDALHRIQELRRISDHPYLAEKCWTEFTNDQLINASAKLQVTISILDDIKNRNEKVIVFTERRDMQKMMQRIFLDRYDLTVSVINGETRTTSKGNNLSRQKTIDHFQEKPGFNIIIMSQLAAGIGLNVTAANHVIHYSRHWNPAKENQATDRVYRIGQTKDVYIYYPMAVLDEFDSFDKVLDNLLRRKMDLANASLYPTDQIEVNIDELGRKVFGANLAQQADEIVSDADIAIMDEYLFESFVAVVFNKQNYECFVTSRSGDKGVDVLANGNKNFAIQCKHCKTNVGNGAIQEVVAGANYYKEKEQKTFLPCVVTNSGYTQQAIELANTNQVELIDGKKLADMLAKTNVSWREVYEMEHHRMG